MSDRIALQLYSVREVAAQIGYEAAIRKVAEVGYKAVETAGFPGTTAQAAAKLFQELGQTIVTAHVGLPIGERKNEILDQVEALGKPPVLCTQIRPDDVKTLDTIKDLTDRLNQGYQAAKERGMQFGIHNHWWEFGELDGRLIHHIMLEQLDPGIFFEVDTYWVKVAGKDPVKIVSDLGARAPLLHIKDGPATREASMTAVGDGVMDVPAILRASGDNSKHWVVELDRCDTDIIEAVRKSHQYLSGVKI